MAPFKLLPVLLLVAGSLSACRSPLSSDELRALAQAEVRWSARGFQDYAIEERHGCFCPVELTQWARVEVVGGNVSRVVLLATGAEVPPTQRSFFRTVEQVFKSIAEANSSDGLEDIVVQFDRQLGFPAHVGFVSKPDIADGGGSIDLRNAGPLP